MPKKSLKRLAGCIAIELVCALAVQAADYQYKAGLASFGPVTALALEDLKGRRAVIVNAAFSVPLPVADAIAAQAIKDFGLERAGLLIHSVASGEPAPQDARTAIGAALGDLQPGFLMFGNGRLTISSHDGRCRTALSAEASLGACTTPTGDLVHSPIRAALRIVDQMKGLQTRDQAPRSVAVQAIALGGSVVIVAAPSNIARPGKGRILAVTPAVENDTRLDVAVGEVMMRVGARSR